MRDNDSTLSGADEDFVPGIKAGKKNLLIKISGKETYIN